MREQTITHHRLSRCEKCACVISLSWWSACLADEVEGLQCRCCHLGWSGSAARRMAEAGGGLSKQSERRTHRRPLQPFVPLLGTSISHPHHHCASFFLAIDINIHLHLFHLSFSHISPPSGSNEMVPLLYSTSGGGNRQRCAHSMKRTEASNR